MEVESWPIDKPIPYKRNARKWSAQAIEKVAASIRSFGFRQPIVVDNDGVIIIGHLRLAAARYLGLAEVPVHVAGDLSADQAKALRIADNRTHEEAEWDTLKLGQDFLDLKLADFDIGLTGFDNNEIIESVFGAGKKGKKKTDTTAQMEGLEFRVVVDCSGEAQQTELLMRFQGEGLKCRALIS